MNITVKKSNIRTIREDDPKFTLNDGIVTCPRAGFEISGKCPAEYRQILMQALKYGYIKPVAYVYGKEITMDSLR
jgi:hypothetical protein